MFGPSLALVTFDITSRIWRKSPSKPIITPLITFLELLIFLRELFKASKPFLSDIGFSSKTIILQSGKTSTRLVCLLIWSLSFVEI